MTIGEHVYRVKVLATEFAPTVRFSDQIIQQYVEYAARRLWRALVGANENRVRKSITVAHGDKLPANWIVAANRAYIIVDTERVAIKPIQIQHIGVRKWSVYNRATAASPDFYIADQRVYFLPDDTMEDPVTEEPYENLTAVTLFHYERPPKLFNVADSTDDGLPAWTSPLVWHLAYSRCLEHYVGAQRRAQLGEQRRQESMQSIKRFVDDLQATQKLDARART